MKRLLLILICTAFLLLLPGCSQTAPAEIAAATLPVYEFTARLCGGTGLTVTRLVTGEVSCLHDYSLSVRQVRAVEGAQLVVLSGAGLEDFLAPVLEGKDILDSSEGIALLTCQEQHSHDHGEHHPHEDDPHIWLSPLNAMDMAENIYHGLCDRYPEYIDIFQTNFELLCRDLLELDSFARTLLAGLSCRELVTFHDGFAYLADCYGLEILRAVEEESGSEASASQLKELITLVESHDLPAIFTERSGSTSAAGVIASETGVAAYALDMAMSGDSYFDAMYHNIQTLKEALG